MADNRISFIQPMVQSVATKVEHQLEWTNEQVIKLIREYSKFPALWDTGCEAYKNKVVKTQNWEEIAKAFPCSRAEVEHKMNIISSQYRRERLKEYRALKAGKPFNPSWYGYKEFHFMNKNKSIKFRERRLIEEDGKSGSGEPYKKNPQYYLQFITPQSKSEVNIAPKKGSEQVFKADSMPSLINIPSNRKKDELDCFGEMVAFTLRKIPSERIRCEVKHNINNLLYQAELKSINK